MGSPGRRDTDALGKEGENDRDRGSHGSLRGIRSVTRRNADRDYTLCFAAPRIGHGS